MVQSHAKSAYILKSAINLKPLIISHKRGKSLKDMLVTSKVYNSKTVVQGHHQNYTRDCAGLSLITCYFIKK